MFVELGQAKYFHMGLARPVVSVVKALGLTLIGYERSAFLLLGNDCTFCSSCLLQP